MSEDFESDVLTGLAVLLDSASIGTWRPDTAYQAGETAIVLGKLPQEPDRVIALASYPVEDDHELSDSILGVQIRTRWEGQDVREVNRLADQIFNFLQAKEGFILSTGIRVVLCLRNSGGLLGQDQGNRWERSDNYYLTLWRPSDNRI